MMSEPSQRLFFALWPDANCRARLSQAVRALREAGAGRPVPAENYHVTLVFLGQLPSDCTELIARCAATVGFEPFTFSLDRYGCFRRPEVAWYGCSDYPVALTNLARDLRGALRGVIEGADEPGPYCPHVTVLRKQPRLPNCPAPVETHWRVRDFVLVSSQFDQGRAVYSVIRRFPAC